MTLYEGLLTVHILAAVLWVGGAAMILILFTKLQKANDGPTIGKLGNIAGDLGKKYFMPLSIVVLASGVWMVLEADWGFERLWVLIGLLGIVATVILGAGFLGPGGEKLDQLVAEKGPGAPEVVAQQNRMMTLSRIDLALLILIIVNMAVKPGT
jgi:uncharacterized membrane protein